MLTKGIRRQWLSTVAPLIACFLFGCKSGWTSWTTTLFMSPKSPFKATDKDVSSMLTIAYTGTIISVVLCYKVASKISRKLIIFIFILTYALAWFSILVTSSMMVIIVCFFVYGVAASMLMIMNYVYLGEIASPRNRELIGVSYAVASSFGNQIEYFISAFDDYRLMALFPFIVSLVGLFMVTFMVESPYYLISRGLEQKALSNFTYLNEGMEQEKILKNFEGVRNYVNEQNNIKENRFLSLFIPDNLKLLIILMSVNAMSIVNCSVIIRQTGSLMIRDFESIINGRTFFYWYQTVSVITSSLSFVTIVRFKRKSMFIYGCILCGLTEFSSAICYFRESQSNNKLEYLAVAIEWHFIAYLLLDSLLWSSALAIVKMEVFPHMLKEFYMSVLAFTSDWCAFALVKSYFAFYPVVGNEVLLMVYGVVAFLCAAIVYKFIPNTKNKTLHQIRVDYTRESCSF